MRYFLQVAALLGFVVLTATPGFAAELRGHWTLDNLTTGIQNQGTDGATSDLTSAVAPTVAPGIIGGALQFAGLTTPATNTTILRTTLPGNVGDDLPTIRLRSRRGSTNRRPIRRAMSRISPWASRSSRPTTCSTAMA